MFRETFFRRHERVIIVFSAMLTFGLLMLGSAMLVTMLRVLFA